MAVCEGAARRRGGPAAPARPAGGLQALVFDFGFWAAVFETRMEFPVMQDLSAAASAAAAAVAEPGAVEAKAKADEALRWLLLYLGSIQAHPSAQSVAQHATLAPRDSRVHRAVVERTLPTLALVNPPAAWPALRLTVTCEDTVSAVCFSPDGAHLLLAVGREARVLDAATGQLLATLV